MKDLKRLMFLLLLAGGRLMAQESDAGLWTGLTGTYKVNKQLDFSAELENRLNDGVRRYNTTLLDLGTTYEFFDFVSGTFTYRIGHRQNNNGSFGWRERFNTDLKFKGEIRKVDLDLRIRWQAGSRNPEERIADYRRAMRYRLKAETKIAKKTRGALVGEIYRGLRNGERVVTDWRLRAEVGYKLAKGESIKVGYMLQREANRANPLLEHIIRVSYSFRIN